MQSFKKGRNIFRMFSTHFSGGPVEISIKDKLETKFQPSHLEILNESHKHSVPKNSETHFKVVVITDQFEGKKLIERHRAVQECLKEELESGVHALSIVAKTSQQWENSNVVTPSPNCLGGSKHDSKN
mmetsp:Transcript_63391/g.72632  ORF Transcript_63391/g.72632 Transcript_63391/m.72632 type:complete len:128 (+) Transcript_63391:167-550(+)